MSPASHDDDVVRRLAEACRTGFGAALPDVLHADAVAVCDRVARPAYGAVAVARLVTGVLGDRPGTVLTLESVNGAAGLALRRAGWALAVVAVRTLDDRVAVLWIVLDPAKLRGWHRR